MQAKAPSRVGGVFLDFSLKMYIQTTKLMNATHEYMGIPDYYCGCLIWQEKGRSFPFCGYDGHITYRAMTRAEVEHWAEQHAHLADDEDIFRLQSIYYRLTSCRSSLDRESGVYPPPY